MSEDNKAITRRAYEAMNAGDFDTLRDLVADNFVEHEEMPGVPPTKEGVLEYFKTMRDAFSDFAMNIEDIGAEGDKVFVRVRMVGKHKGEFMGIPATGNQLDVPTADVLRFENGKVVEHWGVTDSGAMLMQMGVVEMPG